MGYGCPGPVVCPIWSSRGDEYVYYMLDDAIDLLPEGSLVSVVKKYIRLDDLRPDTVERMSLVDRVRRFERVSPASTARPST